MGKHNGKARKTGGLAVGSALVNKARKQGRTGGTAAYLHTTNLAPGGPNMQSVIENNDLDELMGLAELAGRDFTADRDQVIVVSTGAVVAGADRERVEAERVAAEARNRHRLRVPRRPAWDDRTTPEQLDEAERSSFLAWRRELAALEQDERLVLTPFEKNLEVWRQLWRVLERSDIVVQVADARDPLTYRSDDLESYCRALHPTKHTLLLLNKADLLPVELRQAWSAYLSERGVDHLFWSARRASEAVAADGGDDQTADAAAAAEERDGDAARVLGAAELLEELDRRAAAAVAEAEALGQPRASRGDRLVVGLTGYPNVGKSSTINALFGTKKTAVAATPGKTKHFQTLRVSDSLELCDCPGLVLPQYARSRDEMVAAGVIPIDRLTDVRSPVGAVAQRVGRGQLESLYGMRLPVPTVAEDPGRPPTAAEVLRALAVSRGWVAASGLPDETRAGRRILKDYVDGALLACVPPPGAAPEVVAAVEALRLGGGLRGEGPGSSRRDQEEEEEEREEEEQQEAGSSGAVPGAEAGGDADEPAGPSGGPAPPAAGPPVALDDADLDLLSSLNVSGKKAQPTRAPHKFHKKAARSKEGRGTAVGGGGGPAYDGASLPVGKRGGLVRVAGYVS